MLGWGTLHVRFWCVRLCLDSLFRGGGGTHCTHPTQTYGAQGIEADRQGHTGAARAPQGEGGGSPSQGALSPLPGPVPGRACSPVGTRVTHRSLSDRAHARTRPAARGALYGDREEGGVRLLPGSLEVARCPCSCALGVGGACEYRGWVGRHQGEGGLERRHSKAFSPFAHACAA